MKSRDLADLLRRGLAPDNLDSVIDAFDAWSETDPAVGSTVSNILRQVRGRWDDTIPLDEFRRLTDLVVQRTLEILRRTEEESGYAPAGDLSELIREYHRIR
jgi:hypothetical protein